MEPRSLLLVSFFSCTFGDAQLPSLHRLLTASLFWWHCHFLLITIACKTLTCCCVYVNPLVPLRCIIICIVTKVPCTLQKGWCELLESAAPLPVKAVPTKPRNIIVRCAYQKASWSPIFHRFLILHLDVCKRTKLHKQIQKKKSWLPMAAALTFHLHACNTLEVFASLMYASIVAAIVDGTVARAQSHQN